MSDIQIMKDQIQGLITKGENLRKDEKVFIKVQGIQETIVKTELDKETALKDLEKAKKVKKDLITKKNTAVAGATGKIVEKMNTVLPVGKAVFDCTDGLFIGWEIDGTKKPYNGLSGAEKQIFDTALAHILDANIIVMEAAELDNDHLLAALEDLAGIKKQVIINTCHPVKVVPDPFVKIELGEVAA